MPALPHNYTPAFGEILNIYARNAKAETDYIIVLGSLGGGATATVLLYLFIKGYITDRRIAKEAQGAVEMT